MVKVVSMNVRGLRNEQKRLQLFLYIKKLKYDVIMLQETHTEQTDEEQWKRQWGGNIIFSHKDSASRGCAILFSKRTDVEVNKTSVCSQGRYVVIDSIVNKKQLLLANIYAPNEDDPQFFLDLFNVLGLHNYADRIIAGDFNLVFDTKIDALNRKNNNQKARKVLLQLFEDSMMTDVWRRSNPNTFQFTWHRRKPYDTYARLDYIFVSYGILSEVRSIKHAPAYKSDHNAVVMEIECNAKFRRGPGFWKLNDSLLENIESLNRLNRAVDVTILKTKSYEECIRWELVKSTIVKECQQMSFERAKNVNETIDELNKKLNEAKDRLEGGPCEIERDMINKEMDTYNEHLSKHMQYKLKGAQIRSRANWYEQGERNSKYFFGLEKVKYSNKDNNGTYAER